MNEYVYLPLKKGRYIEIKDGVMTLNSPYLVGTFVCKEPIIDNIENYRLLYFKVKYKRCVEFILQNEGHNLRRTFELFVKKDDVEKFIQFRDIMEQYGVFDNRSKFSVLHLDDNETKLKELRDDFGQQLKEFPGFAGWKNDVKVRYLQTVVASDEKVLALAFGFEELKKCMAACTTKRILIITEATWGGIEQSDIMIEKVTSVSYKPEIYIGELHIGDATSDRMVNRVPKYFARPFIEAVNKAREMNKNVTVSNQPPVSDSVHNTSISVADELLKFKNLLDMGAITQEEFEQQKKKLLE